MKIFVPLACLILPILIPVNKFGGRGDHFSTGIFARNTTEYQNVTGLDTLAWGNVRPSKNNRYWVHLVLAVVVVLYTCFIFFDELQGYIRLRQAYLTSPQHRLRASATTVLVTAIPRKWCTYEALDGLYDVFPGGIRNIWINRNYDELNEKVKERNKIALQLESAETTLIREAKKAHVKKVKANFKKDGHKSQEKRSEKAGGGDVDPSAALAEGPGVSSGDPHQVHHNLDEALEPSSGEPSRPHTPVGKQKKPIVPIPVVGQGIEAFTHGIDNVGKAVFQGLRNVGRDVDNRLETTQGFVPEDPQGGSVDRDGNSRSYNAFADHRHHKLNDEQKSHLSVPAQGSLNGETRNSFSNNRHDSDQHDFGYDGIQDIIKSNPVAAGIELKKNPARLEDVKSTSKLQFWKPTKNVPFGIPSPTPHGWEEDEFPLSSPSPVTPGGNPPAVVNGPGSLAPYRNKPKRQNISNEYPLAYSEDYDPRGDGEPIWKEYLKDSDRETMRLPIANWMFSIPFVGKKVDKIDYCRKELARLNLEIEQDQREPEKFPLMNSAFIQFNNQVAAHMACQSVSHHTPSQMAPRIVEISPDDVIWDNMSIKWWESYLRTGGVLIIIGALIIGWAFPVTFTGLLSQVHYLADTFKWLSWLNKLPSAVISIVQGILPQALLALLLFLLPIILRLLARTSGSHTGMAIELRVQQYYFAFLFVQVFLVVSISSAITTVIKQISNGPQNVPQILASNIPKASNYFFSYMLLQAFSTGAGALVQLMGLFNWFILAPIADSTARQKWRRQTSLPDMQWGSFFPVYTNLAAIGLIYSVISPFILIFNCITFSIFWLVYRYNTLYVTKFRFDTGGLLYPTAINQLFLGLYVMELCLVGLFLLVRDADSQGNARGLPCKAQAIIMIVVFIFTVIFQWLLNKAFSPLFRYLPITLEDEAVMRDEAFALAQEKQWRLDDDEREGDDINDVLEAREKRERQEDREAEEIEMQKIRAKRGSSGPNAILDSKKIAGAIPNAIGGLTNRVSWADRSRKSRVMSPTSPHARNLTDSFHNPNHHRHHPHSRAPTDLEHNLNSGSDKIGAALFAGINDEIEDLTPDERDKLVRRAFLHSALRAKRPVIWIPRDELGVSDDEIRRTQRFSKNIWISNDYTALDQKGRVVYRRSPPDFDEVDLIEL